MKCTKDTFPNAGAAWFIADKLASKPGINRGWTARAYPCPRCHQWHVTSKPARRKRKR